MQYDMSVERIGIEGGVRSQSDMLEAIVRLLGENKALSKELDENREDLRIYEQVSREIETKWLRSEQIIRDLQAQLTSMKELTESKEAQLKGKDLDLDRLRQQIRRGPPDDDEFDDGATGEVGGGKRKGRGSEGGDGAVATSGESSARSQGSSKEGYADKTRTCSSLQLHGVDSVYIISPSTLPEREDPEHHSR